MKIYSIKDSVAGTFEKPFLFTNDSLAIRTLKHLINSDANGIDYLQDKQLFNIGEMDLSTGILTPIAPRMVRNLMDLKEVKPNVIKKPKTSSKNEK